MQIRPVSFIISDGNHQSLTYSYTFSGGARLSRAIESGFESGTQAHIPMKSYGRLEHLGAAASRRSSAFGSGYPHEAFVDIILTVRMSCISSTVESESRISNSTCVGILEGLTPCSPNINAVALVANCGTAHMRRPSESPTRYIIFMVLHHRQYLKSECHFAQRHTQGEYFRIYRSRYRKAHSRTKNRESRNTHHLGSPIAAF